MNVKRYSEVRLDLSVLNTSHITSYLFYCGQKIFSQLFVHYRMSILVSV